MLPEPIIVTRIPVWDTVVISMLCIAMTGMSTLCAYVGIRYLQLRAYMHRATLVLPTYQQLGVLVQDYLDNREYIKKTGMVGQGLTAGTYQNVLREQMKATLAALKEIE
jgi:hypothetical protein